MEWIDMPKTTCSMPECDTVAKARGLCNAHYLKARKNGTLPPEWTSRMRPGLANYLHDRIRVAESGCWEWEGPTWPNGYGSLAKWARLAAATSVTHRAVYELNRGPIPDGLVLDHLCRNIICCNPDHLEPVTHQTNLHRGEAPTMKIFVSAVCKHGHDLTEDNLYVSPGGSRKCRTCMSLHSAERHKRRKQELVAYPTSTARASVMRRAVAVSTMDEGCADCTISVGGQGDGTGNCRVECIIEALANLNRTAKRLPHIVGNENFVTPWDNRHRQLNDLLYDWELRS